MDKERTDWISQTASNFISVVYLEDFLPELLLKEANNPYVAVFAPLIITDDSKLIQQAPQLWRTVHAAPDLVRDNLEQILELWFLEHFCTRSYQEVLDMFQTRVPLEETCGYQGIFAKGLEKGEACGILKGKKAGKIEGEIESEARLLQRLIIRRFGKITKWAQQRIEAADTAQLEAWAEAIFDARNLKDLLGDKKDS